MGWFRKKPTVGEAAEGISTLSKTIYSLVKGELPPDEEAKLQLELQRLDQQLMLAQARINEAEANNPHFFVSAWRPFIGWSCGLAIFYNFIIYPMLTWVTFTLAPDKVKLIPPPFTDGLFELVLAMLGVAGYRTFEKLKGIDTKKIGQ